MIRRPLEQVASDRENPLSLEAVERGAPHRPHRGHGLRDQKASQEAPRLPFPLFPKSALLGTEL